MRSPGCYQERLAREPKIDLFWLQCFVPAQLFLFFFTIAVPSFLCLSVPFPAVLLHCFRVVLGYFGFCPGADDCGPPATEKHWYVARSESPYFRFVCCVLVWTATTCLVWTGLKGDGTAIINLSVLLVAHLIEECMHEPVVCRR